MVDWAWKSRFTLIKFLLSRVTIIWNPFFSQTNTQPNHWLEQLLNCWNLSDQLLLFIPQNITLIPLKRLHQGYNPWLMPTNYEQENSAILDTLLASFAYLAFILASTFELTFLEEVGLCRRVQHKEISLSKDT